MTISELYALKNRVEMELNARQQMKCEEYHEELCEFMRKLAEENYYIKLQAGFMEDDILNADAVYIDYDENEEIQEFPDF